MSSFKNGREPPSRRTPCTMTSSSSCGASRRCLPSCGASRRCLRASEPPDELYLRKRLPTTLRTGASDVTFGRTLPTQPLDGRFRWIGASCVPFGRMLPTCDVPFRRTLLALLPVRLFCLAPFIIQRSLAFTHAYFMRIVRSQISACLLSAMPAERAPLTTGRAQSHPLGCSASTGWL